jgi:hypothetical protein
MAWIIELGIVPELDCEKSLLNSGTIFSILATATGILFGNSYQFSSDRELKKGVPIEIWDSCLTYHPWPAINILPWENACHSCCHNACHNLSTLLAQCLSLSCHNSIHTLL